VGKKKNHPPPHPILGKQYTGGRGGVQVRSKVKSTGEETRTEELNGEPDSNNSIPLPAVTPSKIRWGP
jgi:hypothetical protein